MCEDNRQTMAVQAQKHSSWAIQMLMHTSTARWQSSGRQAATYFPDTKRPSSPKTTRALTTVAQQLLANRCRNTTTLPRSLLIMAAHICCVHTLNMWVAHTRKKRATHASDNKPSTCSVLFRRFKQAYKGVLDWCCALSVFDKW